MVDDGVDVVVGTLVVEEVVTVIEDDGVDAVTVLIGVLDGVLM